MTVNANATHEDTKKLEDLQNKINSLRQNRDDLYKFTRAFREGHHFSLGLRYSRFRDQKFEGGSQTKFHVFGPLFVYEFPFQIYKRFGMSFGTDLFYLKALSKNREKLNAVMAFPSLVIKIIYQSNSYFSLETGAYFRMLKSFDQYSRSKEAYSNSFYEYGFRTGTKVFQNIHSGISVDIDYGFSESSLDAARDAGFPRTQFQILSFNILYTLHFL